MKKDGNMMSIVMMVGGLGLAYWYITRYGPQGAAYNSAGQQVALTWWDSWFGGATAATQATTTTTTTGPTTVTQTPAGSTTPLPSTTTDVRTKLLTAAGGVNSLNADQWDYYRNQLYPPSLSSQQFGLAFPTRTDPMPTMSVDDFIAALTAAGINPASPGAGVSGIYNTPSRPAVPSMSFGGSLANNRPRIASPSVYRNRPVGGGGYIQ